MEKKKHNEWSKYYWKQKKLKLASRRCFCIFTMIFFYHQVNLEGIRYFHKYRKIKVVRGCIARANMWEVFGPSCNACNTSLRSKYPFYRVIGSEAMSFSLRGVACGRWWYSLSPTKLSLYLFSLLLSKFTLAMQNFRIVLWFMGIST
jgi:hypothetical protein